MKTFNIITCVIVLILALVSAVFSYFLYEKRVQFVDGWMQMSNAIHTSAQTIDTQSDNKFAPELTAQKLSHKTYSKSGMDNQLKNLTQQSAEFVKQYENALAGWAAMSKSISESARNIEGVFRKGAADGLAEADLALDNKTFNEEEFGQKVGKFTALNKDFVRLFVETRDTLRRREAELRNVTQQRDQMADTFARIGSVIGAGTGTKADFANLSTYRARINKISSAVSALYSSRSAIVDQIDRIAGKKVDRNAIYSNARNGIRPLEDAVNAHKNARIKYAGALSSIAARLKVAGFKDDLSKGYSDPGKIVSTNNSELAKIPALQGQLSSAHRNIGNLQTTVANRDKEIKRLNGVIGDYKTILALKDSDADPQAWVRGSNNARSVVVGTVSKVSPDYGYIVIDFGTETTVTQTIGNKTLLINPDLESGLNFNITRDGEFIAAVTLNNVDKTESTANIPTGKAGMIKVGDKVTFKK